MAYRTESPTIKSSANDSITIGGPGQGRSGGSDETSGRGDFYEIEPALIVDTLTEDHPSFEELGGYSMINAVKFQLLYSDSGLGIDSLLWALPLSGNLRESPLNGELVCIVYYLGIPFWHKRINYMNTINGSISNSFGSDLEPSTGGKDYKKVSEVGPREVDQNNFLPGLNFYENYFIQPLKLSEGDMTYEGRLGQTLRLGHLARGEGEDPYELSNIKLRVGQLTDAEANDRATEAEEAVEVANKPVDENINDDGCSLWMTLGEEVGFSPGKPTEPAESLFKSLTLFSEYEIDPFGNLNSGLNEDTTVG